MNYIPRHLSNVVEETARTFPVTLVTGPRQVGKTTLLRELLPDASYTTLDRLDALDSAEQEPERFLRSLSKPAIIDNKLVLPHPLGPTILTNSPCSTRNEMSSMAAVSPSGVWYVSDT